MLGVLRRPNSAPWRNIPRRLFHHTSLWRDSSGDKDNNNDNNNDKDKIKNSDKKNGGDASVVLPSSSASSIVIRDQAPRFPHTLGLPIVSRPIFPGLVTSVTLTDPATIKAIEDLPNSKNGAEPAYVSAFLRQKYSTGVTENGTLLTTPEVITDPAELYSVGTFCQVQRLSRHDGEDSATLLLLAHRRVHLESVDNVGPPIDVTVQHWKPETTTAATNDDSLRALTNEVISTIREIAQV